MRIEEVKSTTRAQRVATHSHVKGLGLNDDGSAAEVAADEERRRAARAARGPALVETFQAKKSTAPAQKPAKWTRDAMDAPQRMDAKAARAVIEKAKGLDSRFSSSYRQ